jgi:hypothetical protein
MKYVPFVNYIRGGQGRTEEILAPVQDDEYEKFLEMRKHDCFLTVEKLSTGQISQCIQDPRFGDYDIMITDNGPEVVVKRREMLLDFTTEKLLAWREDVDNV